MICTRCGHLHGELTVAACDVPVSSRTKHALVTAGVTEQVSW